MKNKILSVFIILTVALLSCNSRTFYQKTDNFPNQTWNMDSTLVYKVTILDSLQYYNFYINVTNTANYPYQNLYLFFTAQFPDSTAFTDTLNCILCDAHGDWTGKKVGKIMKNRFTLKSKVRFPQTGTYIFSVQQAMREEDLIGINNFGIILRHE